MTWWALLALAVLWLCWGSYRAGVRRADATIDSRGGMSPETVQRARETLRRLTSGVRE